MPQASVVIPLYNKGPHIARALTSIQKQTCQDFEAIVVDDGSTDNGPEVVKSYGDPRIRLIRQENQGVSASRNRGVKEAMTDLVVFLDADDEWTPSHLETILRLRKNFPEAGMYINAYKWCMPDGRMKSARYKGIPPSPWEGLVPNYFKSSIDGDCLSNASAIGIPKRVFQEVGGFPMGYWWGEDHDLFGKIALKYPVAFSWTHGAIYHLGASNRASSRSPSSDYVEPFVETARKAMSNSELPQAFIEPLAEFIYRKEIERAKVNVLAGKSRAALEILRKCKTKKFSISKFEWMILARLPLEHLLLLRRFKRALEV